MLHEKALGGIQNPLLSRRRGARACKRDDLIARCGGRRVKWGVSLGHRLFPGRLESFKRSFESYVGRRSKSTGKHLAIEAAARARLPSATGLRWDERRRACRYAVRRRRSL